MKLFIALILIPFSALANPIEIGTINWTRNFDKALEVSKSSNKPVFLLFQEVPGCHGCKKFGKEVLSDPIIKKVVEEEFVPLFIYNNRGGKDAEILKRYKEASWNFQVVRFLDSSGEDLIPRKDKVWTTEGIKKRIKLALIAANKEVPNYLNSSKLSSAWFSMFCYWTGEMELGAIEGVKGTEAGYFQNREVTKVNYDSSIISLKNLAQKASAVDCARKVFVNNTKELEQIKNLKLTAGIIDQSKYKKPQQKIRTNSSQD